jgi:hypothetical protein
LFAALVFALALFVGAPMSTAHASEGQPAGWTTERASAEVIVGRVVLHYEPSLHDDAMDLAQRIPSMWSEIEQALSTDLDDRLHVYFMTHAGRVAAATDMPQWVAGVAHSSTGEIMIARHSPDGSPTNLEALLKHEMAHVALHRASGGAEVPRWFHEGVAESFEDNVDLARAQTLAGLVFGRGVPDIEDLDASFYSDDPVVVSGAYAASRDLVNFLRYRDGTGDDFKQLLAELRLGHTFDASFIRTYKSGLRELVGEWRAGLPGRFVWYPLIAGGGMPLGVLLPLIIAAWVRRRRVLKAGWQRLEQEEVRLRESLGLTTA